MRGRSGADVPPLGDDLARLEFLVQLERDRATKARGPKELAAGGLSISLSGAEAGLALLSVPPAALSELGSAFEAARLDAVRLELGPPKTPAPGR